VLEGPTSLSSQLHWGNFTKSFLPLVKKLPIFDYKWVNVKLYSIISCEDGILKNLSDFSRNVWTTLKFEEDSKFILFQNFLLAILREFEVVTKRKIVPYASNYLYAKLRILNIGKVTVSNFKVWVSENHWNYEMKPGPLVSLSSRLTVCTRLPVVRTWHHIPITVPPRHTVRTALRPPDAVVVAAPTWAAPYPCAAQAWEARTTLLGAPKFLPWTLLVTILNPESTLMPCLSEAHPC
jgi:hypothetical protein